MVLRMQDESSRSVPGGTGRAVVWAELTRNYIVCRPTQSENPAHVTVTFPRGGHKREHVIRTLRRGDLDLCLPQREDSLANPGIRSTTEAHCSSVVRGFVGVRRKTAASAQVDRLRRAPLLPDQPHRRSFRSPPPLFAPVAGGQSPG